MASVYKELGQQLLAVTTVVTVYTVPAGKSAIVSAITVVNVSDTLSSTIKLWRGGTGDANVLQPALTLGPKEKLVLRGPAVFSAGKTLSAQAGTANVLNILAEGSEVS